MRRWGFRTRLTLWHTATTTAVLLAVAGSADWLLTQSVFGQLDSALLVIGETEAASSLDSPAGLHLHEVEALFDSKGQAVAGLDKFVQMIDSNGSVLLRSRSLGTSALPSPPSVVAHVRRGERAVETTSLSNGEPIRLLTLPINVSGSHPFAVQVGTPLRPTYAFLQTARLLWLGATIAILGAIITTGAILARTALKPVASVVAQAQRIGQAISGRRLPHPGTDDEIGRLVSTLNQMLDRLERSIEVDRRFTADAAHELRSPLSRLRSELEIALRQPRSTSEYQAVIRSGLDETERMTDLIVSLLTLAHLDAGDTGWVPGTPVGVTSDAFEAECGRLRDEANLRRIDVVIDPSPRLEVLVPPGMLTLLVGNLLHNAIKFSPPGGRVCASAIAIGGEAVLSVTDQGPGVPADQMPKIFDRFFRGDPARSGAVPGVGLGLSICRAIAERYHGTIDVARNPAGGLTFSVRVPLAPARSDQPRSTT
ncbi:MAG: HAMP domain-containing sensor histidine kinase [Acidobacteria bacterium]|nr:HAMP domain-containing sensor histidine kinase [Acidobacteriota bacterium]